MRPLPLFSCLRLFLRLVERPCKQIRRGPMKVIVADKISERGVELLRSAGWNIVLTTKETLNAEIADEDELVVRSATKVTLALLGEAQRLRGGGRAGACVDNVDQEEATR